MHAYMRALGYPAPVGLGLCCPALGEPEQQKPLNSETRHLGKLQSVKTRSIYSQVWEESTTLQTVFIHHSEPAWSSAWFVPSTGAVRGQRPDPLTSLNPRLGLETKCICSVMLVPPWTLYIISSSPQNGPNGR